MPRRGEQFGIYEVVGQVDISTFRAIVSQHIGMFLSLLVKPIDQERDMGPIPICVRLDGDLAPPNQAPPLTIFEGKMARLIDDSNPAMGYEATNERVVLDTVELSPQGNAVLMRPTSELALWVVPHGGQPDAPSVA